MPFFVVLELFVVAVFTLKAVLVSTRVYHFIIFFIGVSIFLTS